MKFSGYRLSHSMRDMLKGMVVGGVRRSDGDFSIVTAQALRKRGLFDDNLAPTELGRSVAAELIKLDPKQYQYSVIDRLIFGLQIIRLYKEDAVPFSMSSSSNILAFQDVALSSLSEDHRLSLQDFGWCQQGTYWWSFSSN